MRKFTTQICIQYHWLTIHLHKLVYQNIQGRAYFSSFLCIFLEYQEYRSLAHYLKYVGVFHSCSHYHGRRWESKLGRRDWNINNIRPKCWHRKISFTKKKNIMTVLLTKVSTNLLQTTAPKQKQIQLLHNLQFGYRKQLQNLSKLANRFHHSPYFLFCVNSIQRNWLVKFPTFLFQRKQCRRSTRMSFNFLKDNCSSTFTKHYTLPIWNTR